MTARELLTERAREVLAAASADVPSPCISVCRMDPASGLCEGCLRTLDEIAEWGRADEEARRAVWLSIGERVARDALTPTLSQGEREEAR